MKGIQIRQGSLIDMELVCGVACYLEEMLGHLQLRSDNLIVNGLSLLHCICPSLTIAGISLLLERLFEPFVKYKCPARIIGL